MHTMQMQTTNTARTARRELVTFISVVLPLDIAVLPMYLSRITTNQNKG